MDVCVEVFVSTRVARSTWDDILAAGIIGGK